MAVAAAVMGGVAFGDPIPEDARLVAAEADDIDAIIRKIRKDYPEYADWSDAELRAAISAKFAMQAKAKANASAESADADDDTYCGLDVDQAEAALLRQAYGGRCPRIGDPMQMRGSVADRIRATGLGAAIRPPLSDEDLVKRAEAREAFYAQSVIDILCIMAAEVEIGMLELAGATRNTVERRFGKGSILADESDKNIYATTLKAAKLAGSLRKEAEKRGGSCDTAHSAEGCCRVW